MVSGIERSLNEKISEVIRGYSRFDRPTRDEDLSRLKSILKSRFHDIIPEFFARSEICLGYQEKRRQRLRYALLLGEQFGDIFLNRIQETLEPYVELPEIRSLYRYGLRVPEIGNIIRSSVRRRRSNTIFLLTPTLQYLKELQGRLARTGDLLNLIELLRNRIDYLKDIRQVGEDFLVFMKGLRRPVPLEGMGDGFRAKLTILSAISTVKKGVALMEEPETRLHPGFMSSIVNQIVETAARGDLQYIISTHSLDFLEFILEANVDLTSVVRMYMKESEIDYEILSGKEAKEELSELKMDLRGV